LKVTNVMNLPEAFVNAVHLEKHNEPGTLSATTLLNGIKQIILRDRHWDEIEEDVADHVYALFGQAVHSLLEEEGEHEFTEEKMAFEMDGIVITGRIDNYNMDTGVISDYKNITAWKVIFKDFKDWNRQGLIYAWLLIKNSFKAQTCRFIAFMKDHSKRDAKRDSSYPQKPVYVHQFNVDENGLAEIEAFLKGKITEYKRCVELSDDEIPPCTPEERWDKPTKYAVKKEGNKRAYKVLDTLADAEKLAAEMGKGYSVETRLGESIRCMDYCSCNKFCNYYREKVAPVEAQDEVNWP